MPTVYDDYASRIASEEEILEELRAGELLPSTPIRHAPWTGDATLPLSEVPALAEIVHGPQARMARRFQRTIFPWVTLTYGGLLLLTGIGWLALLGRNPEVLLRHVAERGVWVFWSAMLLPELHRSDDVLFCLLLFGPALWVLPRLERALGAGSVLLSVLGAATLAGVIVLPLLTHAIWLAPLVVGAALGTSLGMLRHRVLVPSLHRDPFGPWGLLVFAPSAAVLWFMVADSSRWGLSFLLGTLLALLLGATLTALLPPQSTRKTPWPHLLAALLLLMSPLCLLLFRA